MKLLKNRKGRLIPPLAFAILMVIILIFIVAFVPEVRSLVIELFGGGATNNVPINGTP